MDMDTRKILMVDDDVMYLARIARALEAFGFEVTKAYEVTTAIQLLKENSYQLIILDLLMPPPESENLTSEKLDNLDFRESGSQLYFKIREELGQPNVPVIFLTLVRDVSILSKIQLAAKKYSETEPLFLSKPSPIHDLISEIERLVK